MLSLGRQDSFLFFVLFVCLFVFVFNHLHCSYTVSFTHYLWILGLASSGTSFSTYASSKSVELTKFSLL